MRKASRFLRGGARLRVTGADLSRFLARCAEGGLVLEDVGQEERFSCLLTIPLRDLPGASRIAERCGCRLEVLRRTGLPLALRAARRRAVLALGMLLVLLGLAASSLFVWEIRVTENDTDVPDGEILRVLAEQGVGVGSFWPGFRPDLIRARALLELPELSWIAVNLNGTRAGVQVRQRVPAPEIWDPRAPGDLCAARGGVILRLTVLEGTPLVRRGDAVEPGQVLISADRPMGAAGNARQVHARGEVWARTMRQMSLSAPLQGRSLVRGGPVRRRFGLLWGDRLYFFSRSSGISSPDCDRILKIQPVGIQGLFSLPLSLVWESLQRCEERELARDPAVLRRELEAELSQRLQAELGAEGERISAVFSQREENGLLTVTLRAECAERIDREQPRER